MDRAKVARRCITGCVMVGGRFQKGCAKVTDRLCIGCGRSPIGCVLDAGR